MKSRLLSFNLYLLIVLLLAGCKSTPNENVPPLTREQKKQLTAIGFHLEAQNDTTGRAEPVEILRTDPILVNVLKESFLDERDVLNATLVESVGGFVIQIQFDDHGVFVFDTVTTSHKGKRIAILANFTKQRWLAAPVISRRVTNGVLTFTPDATREEAERIVRGLNNTSLKLRKKNILSGP